MACPDCRTSPYGMQAAISHPSVRAAIGPSRVPAHTVMTKDRFAYQISALHCLTTSRKQELWKLLPIQKARVAPPPTRIDPAPGSIRLQLRAHGHPPTPKGALHPRMNPHQSMSKPSFASRISSKRCCERAMKSITKSGFYSIAEIKEELGLDEVIHSVFFDSMVFLQ